ncbi:metallophosphoesterase [Azohydromonas caseinilytica]|uniref:Metallophosphoesterase n=1 Tax=Azohydromonas caseinilytica TaxID=2728836 RepID=A0A848FEG7_9BURK|nr:metallophosphoesterase [Azohydromonas caseinilytica]NML17215.1 metallophosphoesterase [Azohydromonas caseinilytica]
MHAALPDGPLDIVGDVHGEHEALCALLAALGYDAAGTHPQGRRLVFVGDLCDRGPDSPGVVARVRALVRAGRAVVLLGNHELNLLRGQRKQGSDWFWNEGAHRDLRFVPYATLNSEAERAEVLAFFETLPLALSRADLRVAHAAWDTAAVARLAQLQGQGTRAELFEWLDDATDATLQAQGWRAAARAEKASWRHRLGDPAVPVPMLEAVARCDEVRQRGNPLRVLTSGLERRAGAPFFHNAQWRFTERVPWWNGYAEDTPVVVGHFWRHFPPLQRAHLGRGGPDLFEGVPHLAWLGARGKVFCVDYSVGGRWLERRGEVPCGHTRLAALRWPERTLVLDSGETVETTGFDSMATV